MIAQGSEKACPTGRVMTNEPRHKTTYSNGTLYVAQCELGRGVFARRAIRRGEILLAFGGPLIDFAETKRRGASECMAIQVGPDKYIDTQPPGVFVNHSCAPNTGIRNDWDLVALRDIPQGEEIRYDYSTSMDEKSFTMRCQCGSPGCRQVVTDFAELPAAVQDYYLCRRLVMSFIVRRLRGLRATASWEPTKAVATFERVTGHSVRVGC
jgi:hypothetical protein